MTACPRLLRAACLAPALGVLVAAAPAQAQGDPDFLFRRPTVSLGFELGFAVPSAESEIFDFSREELTLGRQDFNAFHVGGEVAFRATERLDLVLGLAHSSREATSEFRDWEGTDGLPIEQSTRFWRVPVTLGVKVYLLERGRSVGRHAWVPARWSPYVGAGGGLMRYGFEQEGEFVDFETLDIFNDRFVSQGTTGTAHVLAGAAVSLRRSLELRGETRYRWAEHRMGRDFVGFDPIDLSGFEATLGIAVRF